MDIEQSFKSLVFRGMAAGPFVGIIYETTLRKGGFVLGLIDGVALAPCGAVGAVAAWHAYRRFGPKPVTWVLSQFSAVVMAVSVIYVVVHAGFQFRLFDDALPFRQHLVLAAATGMCSAFFILRDLIRRRGASK